MSQDRSQSRCNPPLENALKLNSDVAWFESRGTKWLGWTIRDSRGSLVSAGRQIVRKKYNEGNT